MDRSKQPGIEIAQVVVEHAHFEHRDDYLSLPASRPVATLPFALKSEYALGPRGQHAVVRLSLTTDRTKRPLYAIDVAVVALVRPKSGEENMPLEQYAIVHSTGMLFPFIRELVANLTGRGRFGPVWLHPVNLAVASGVQAPGAGEGSNVREGRPRYSAKPHPTGRAKGRRK